MSVDLFTGFDLLNGQTAPLGIFGQWTAVVLAGGASYSQPNTTAGRFGGQAARLGITNAGSGIRQVGVSRAIGTSSASRTIGIAIRVNDLSRVASSGLPLAIQLREGTTYHGHLCINVDGSITYYRASSGTAGTALGSSAAGVIVDGVWHYLELEIVIDDSVGRVSIYVGDVSVLNLTGQDTRNGGTSGVIDTINLMVTTQLPAATPTIDYDDLYITNSAARLGERKVETPITNSDTAQIDFSPSAGSDNYACVDEQPSDGDTTYVQASTVGDQDLYGHAGLSDTPTNIDAVQVVAVVRKTDAASRAISLSALSGATPDDAPDHSLSATYEWVTSRLNVDPNTAAAWTPSAVNSLKFGQKVTV